MESNEKQHLVWAENTNSVAARPQGRRCSTHFTSALGGGEKDIVFEKPICPREFAACDGPLACLMNAGDTARWLAAWMQLPTCVF